MCIRDSKLHLLVTMWPNMVEFRSASSEISWRKERRRRKKKAWYVSPPTYYVGWPNKATENYGKPTNNRLWMTGSRILKHVNLITVGKIKIQIDVVDLSNYCFIEWYFLSCRPMFLARDAFVRTNRRAIAEIDCISQSVVLSWVGFNVPLDTV